MASVTNRPNGHRWIQFTFQKKKKTIRLGKVDPGMADSMKKRIEDLITCAEHDEPRPVELQRWLSTISETVHEKLVATGLVDARTLRTLDELMAAWIKSCQWSESTHQMIEPFVENMRTYFGGSSRITSITDESATEFRKWLLANGASNGGRLAKATVSRRVRWARQLFLFAESRKAIIDNPFSGQRGFSEVNRERDFFVGRDLIDALFEKTTDLELKAAIALARYGATRCPSEVLPTKWTQINWETKTMIVKAPKTGQQRTVPIFPALLVHLNALWETIEEGEFVFPTLMRTPTGLTSKLETLCHRAGFAMWQKPWQNMRSTCETEWLQSHPIHKVASWMGHSPLIALKHYAQVSNEQTAIDAAAGLKADTNCQRAEVPQLATEFASPASGSARDKKPEAKPEANHEAPSDTNHQKH
jgi:integrase